MYRVVLSVVLFPYLFLSGCAGLPTQFSAPDNQNPPSAAEAQGQIEQTGTIRIKYHNLWNTARFMVIEGSFADNAKKYPLILDTGATQSLFVKNSHVRDNHLPIASLKEEINGYNIKNCLIPQLNIGGIKFVNWPAFYLEPHTDFNPFAFLAQPDDSIIVGLPALRHFKYIVFDSETREVEFSSGKSFTPAENTSWQKYPLTIEEDLNGNAFLFVDILIAGQKVQVQLDTGNGNGLAIQQSLWNKISPNIPPVKMKKGQDFYPYIGRLNCKKTIVPQLQLGDKMVNEALVSVFPDDCPLLDESDALLGMNYFLDTAITLDFENSLLWVKK
jgi:predicted aspartyl protease